MIPNVYLYAYFGYRELAASGIGAVLHTISNKSDPDGALWRMIVDTECMSYALSSPAPPDKLIQEIVIAYNNAGTYAKRIQVLSLIATKKSFKYLNQFNSKSASSKETGAKIAELDCDGDDDNAVDVPAIIPRNCFFNPPLSYHIYRLARLHHKDNGHGLSPVDRGRSFAWQIPLEVVDTIIDFVSSPLNTQNVSLDICSNLIAILDFVNVFQVAYGTLRIKDPRSKKFQRIARIIRLHTKTELVKQLEKYLKEKKFAVPSRATLFKILSKMPAATIKVNSKEKLNIISAFFHSPLILGNERN